MHTPLESSSIEKGTDSKCTIQMVTNEKQGKIELTNNWTDESGIDYRSPTKTGLTANIDGPCNLYFSLDRLI